MKKKHHGHMSHSKHKSHHSSSVSHGTSENEGHYWGKGEHANMPKEVIMKDYPKGGYSTDDHLDDTITRLESDTEDAEHIVKRQSHRSMY